MSAVHNLLDFQGTWSSTFQYSIVNLTDQVLFGNNANQYFQVNLPVVYYNNNLYYATTAQPTIGIDPVTNSSQWALLASLRTTYSKATGVSPVTNNALTGAVTFTGVSIAANASQTFVLNNSSITSTSQVITSVITSSFDSNAQLILNQVSEAVGTISYVVKNIGTATQSSNITISFRIEI